LLSRCKDKTKLSIHANILFTFFRIIPYSFVFQKENFLELNLFRFWEAKKAEIYLTILTDFFKIRMYRIICRGRMFNN